MKEMSVNEKSYVVLKLLGHGKGGYSYLVTDGIKEYVLKQIHHEPCDYYQFGNKIESEMKDYEHLKEIGIPMPKMFEVDIEQERILKEYIKGDTVFDYVLRDEVRPDYVEQVKKCVKLYMLLTPISIISRLILWCRKISYTILITSVTIIWRNGILKIGESNTGPRQKSFWNVSIRENHPKSIF